MALSGQARDRSSFSIPDMMGLNSGRNLGWGSVEDVLSVLNEPDGLSDPCCPACFGRIQDWNVR